MTEDVFEDFLSKLPDPDDPVILTIPPAAFRQFAQAQLEAHELDGRGESPLSLLATRWAVALAFFTYDYEYHKILELAMTFAATMFVMGYFAHAEDWLALTEDEIAPDDCGPGA